MTASPPISHSTRFVTLEQESLGGCVFQYPRGKIVMTQPARLPIVGNLKLILAALKEHGVNPERDLKEVVFAVKGDGAYSVFKYEGGIKSFVEHLNRNKTPLHKPPIHIEDDKDGTTVEDHKVEVPDFLATVCKVMGMDPFKKNTSNVGRQA